MENTSNEQTPYSRLDPTVVMDAIETVGYRCTGSVFALNSYENRVYDVGVEGGPNVVAKFYRPGRWSLEQIREEHFFAFQLEEAEVPVLPPLRKNGESLFEHAGYIFCLYPKRGGQSIELQSDEDYRHMGRLIARIHSVGSWSAYEHRPAFTPQLMGWQNVEALKESPLLPPDLLDNYSAVTTHVLSLIDQLWGERKFNLRLHGDCHLGNILNDGEIFFVDLDDSLSGPAVQDLWLFTNGEPEEVRRQFQLLLEGYTTIRDFDYTERNLIEPLRALRMIHYTAWIAKRYADPTFQKNFNFIETHEYWQKHIAALQEQLYRMQMPEEIQTY